MFKERGRSSFIDLLNTKKFSLSQLIEISRSRDSSVGITTGCGLDGLGLIPGSVGFFSSLQGPDHPASNPKGTGAVSSGVERQGR
jgi:hypothetical protein